MRHPAKCLVTIFVKAFIKDWIISKAIYFQFTLILKKMKQICPSNFYFTLKKWEPVIWYVYEDGTKFKIPSEIMPPSKKKLRTLLLFLICRFLQIYQQDIDFYN